MSSTRSVDLCALHSRVAQLGAGGIAAGTAVLYVAHEGSTFPRCHLWSIPRGAVNVVRSVADDIGSQAGVVADTAEVSRCARRVVAFLDFAVDLNVLEPHRGIGLAIAHDHEVRGAVAHEAVGANDLEAVDGDVHLRIVHHLQLGLGLGLGSMVMSICALCTTSQVPAWK